MTLSSPSIAASTSSAPALVNSPTPSDETKPERKISHPPREYCILFLGAGHKQPLLEKMLLSADRFERHIQYQDTVYLYYTTSEETFTVELNDPGIEHTGAREMAIRKADAVILCYAAYDADSFHQLSSIVDDFKFRKNGIYPPVLLICNEDELLDQKKSHESNNDLGKVVTEVCTSIKETKCEDEQTLSSTSEGYQSADEHSTQNSPISHSKSHGSLTVKRPSMENIRKSREDFCPITEEQGKNMAKLFGPDCEFLSIPFNDYREAGDLINRLIGRILFQRANHGKSNSERRKRDRRQKSPLLSLRRRRSTTAPLGTASLKFLKNKIHQKKEDKKRNIERDESTSSTESLETHIPIPDKTKRSKSIVMLQHDHHDGSISPSSQTSASTTNLQARRNHSVATSPLSTPTTPNSPNELPIKKMSIVDLNSSQFDDNDDEYITPKNSTAMEPEKQFKNLEKRNWSIKRVAHKSSNVCVIS